MVSEYIRMWEEGPLEDIPGDREEIFVLWREKSIIHTKFLHMRKF